MRKLMITLGAAVIVAMGWSSTVVDDTAKTITITVDADTTIAAALDEGGLGYASINGGAYAEYKIIKKGDGVLKFPSTDAADGGVALANWTGDLEISEGVVMTQMPLNNANTHVSMLGSISSGKVTVADGAALYIEGKKGTSASAQGIQRPIYITGAGTTDYPGAIMLKPPVSGGGNDLRNVSPYRVYLNGDATICHTQVGDEQVVSEQKYRYLCGHTLTIKRKEATAGGFVDLNYSYPGSTSSEYNANAKVIYDRIVLNSRVGSSGLYRNYSEGNEIHFRNGAYFNYGNNSGTYGEQWKIVYESTAAGKIQSSVWGFEGDWIRTNRYSTMYGPVQLDRDLGFTYGSWADAKTPGHTKDNAAEWAVQDHNIGFLGPISGVGGVNFSCPISSRTYKHSILNLGGANTFLGPLTLKDCVLGMFNTEAIPAESSKVTMNGAMVVLANDAAINEMTYKMRSAEFSGNSAITNAVFNGLAKVSGTPTVKSGTLTTVVPFTDDSRVTIASGATVKTVDPSAAAKRKANAGCLYGCQRGNGTAWPGTSGVGAAYINFAAYGYKVYVNKKINSIPYDFDLSILGGWSKTYHQNSTTGDEGYRTYSGYLWNDESTEKTWSVLVTLNIYYRLIINGKSVDNSPTNPAGDAKVFNFTLKPGANYFSFVCGVMYVGDTLTGPTRTGNVSNLPAKCQVGVFYDKQGRGTFDYNDYEEFSTAGELPVMTATDCSAQVITLGTLAGEGTVEVAADTTARATMLEDPINVTSGTLELKMRGKVDSMSFGAGKFKLNPMADYYDYIAKRKAVAGLIYGYKTGLNSSGNATASYVDPNRSNGKMTVTNATCTTVRLPYDMDHTLFNSDKSKLLQTASNSYRSYEGYIWNDEDTDKTWTILIIQNEYMSLQIGDKQITTDGDTNYKSVAHDFTLKPGPNKFIWICWNRFSTAAYYGPTRTSDVVNYQSGETCGLFYDKQGRGTKDINNYAKFSADEELPLFTTKAVAVPDSTTVSFDEITCVEGTEIDCNGMTVSVGQINGVMPKVTNGKIVGSVSATSYPERMVLSDNCELTMDITDAGTKTTRNGVAGVVYGYEYTNSGRTDASYVDMSGYGWSIRSNGGVLRVPYDFDCNQYNMTYANSWVRLFQNKNNAYRTYSGYIWNDSPTNSTWVFLSTDNGFQQIKVNGVACKHAIQNSAQDVAPTNKGKPEPFRSDFVMQPGPNYFEAVYGNSYGSQVNGVYNYGMVRTNNLENWTADKYYTGMMFDRQGRGSMDANDYEVFSANEPHALLTSALPYGFGYLECGTNLTINLSGNDNVATTLKGIAKVTNGTLEVGDVWYLNKAQVEGGASAAAMGLKFAEGARLVITDTTMQEIYDDMHEANAAGYVLATGVTGCPKLVYAEGDRRMTVVNRGGTLTLIPGLGTLIVVQ